MADTTFRDFIEQQTAPATIEVDWGQRHEKWLQDLAQFYKLVQEFMCEYVEQGKVRLQRGTKDLREEFIGNYSVETLTLHIGPNEIDFDPIGTNLIGARGRVDMCSARGTVKFVLVPEDATTTVPRFRVVEGANPVPEPVVPEPNWTWKIATPPPEVRCVDLCKDSFQDAVMEVVNG